MQKHHNNTFKNTALFPLQNVTTRTINTAISLQAIKQHFPGRKNVKKDNETTIKIFYEDYNSALQDLRLPLLGVFA